MLLTDRSGGGTPRCLGAAVGRYGSETCQEVAAESEKRARLDVSLQWLVCVERRG